MDSGPDVIKVVIAKAMETLNETFEVRNVHDGVIALSGIIANGDAKHPTLPILNCILPGGAKRLADLILKTHKELKK